MISRCFCFCPIILYPWILILFCHFKGITDQQDFNGVGFVRYDFDCSPPVAAVLSPESCETGNVFDALFSLKIYVLLILGAQQYFLTLHKIVTQYLFIIFVERDKIAVGKFSCGFELVKADDYG